MFLQDTRLVYGNTKERMKHVPNERIVLNSPPRMTHQQIEKNQQIFVSSSEQHPAEPPHPITGRSNISSDTTTAIKYYREITEEDSIDLTKECENQETVVKDDSKFHPEVSRCDIKNQSIGLDVQENSDQISNTSQCEDFDISIPFNESNILIKVLAPDGRNPKSYIPLKSHLMNRQPSANTVTQQTGSTFATEQPAINLTTQPRLKDARLYVAEPAQPLPAPKTSNSH